LAFFFSLHFCTKKNSNNYQKNVQSKQISVEAKCKLSFFFPLNSRPIQFEKLKIKTDAVDSFCLHIPWLFESISQPSYPVVSILSQAKGMPDRNFILHGRQHWAKIETDLPEKFIGTEAVIVPHCNLEHSGPEVNWSNPGVNKTLVPLWTTGIHESFRATFGQFSRGGREEVVRC